MLIVIDPTARQTDGEAVRIARDVLCAGVGADGVKVCVLDQPQAMTRVLARRGGRRVVIVGDDGALLRAVRLLLRSGELGDASPLGMVPVGPGPTLAVARALGLPTDAVKASRAILTGGVRRVDVLTDDAGGVVLGALGIPAQRTRLSGPTALWWRTVHRPRQRLRVEADGRVLADGDRPVTEISLRAANGLAEVVVSPGQTGHGDVRARATSVTVSGPAFSYRADAVDSGPTRARTWTVRPGALRLAVPVR
ncbi:diacylglycerol kinase family protein [Streptomyces sp. URMC 129]|uniref:diacylglycerol kinase family protein n=1 Tax=Streptomyces sp. URMC 129 TaxID=3423407 RepID=UPI003F1BD73B